MENVKLRQNLCKKFVPVASFPSLASKVSWLELVCIDELIARSRSVGGVFWPQNQRSNIVEKAFQFDLWGSGFCCVRSQPLLVYN